MTQNDVCGEEITRNNLSLIESGKSLPSLPTLCLIAERLNVPVGYFLTSDSAEDAKFANFFALYDIKDAFAKGDYKKCIELCELIPEESRRDELCFFLARSHFIEALRSADSFKIADAQAHLKAALSASDSSQYLGEDFTAAISYYELLLRSLYEHSIPKELCNYRNASGFVDSELILYFSMLTNEDFDFTRTTFRKDCHSRHAEANRLIRTGEKESAYNILSSLSDTADLPYYMVFRVLDDLERIASEVGMFKVAYTAAKNKIKLMSL